ncbi:hypothetical protein BASA60_002503 [Batrachochytrium salamandrivorans]|nr:hypothetical protein BASA60_002503 [Batrachochytrium salamandrivorans]
MAENSDSLGFKHPLADHSDYIAFNKSYKDTCLSRLTKWEECLLLHSSFATSDMHNLASSNTPAINSSHTIHSNASMAAASRRLNQPIIPCHPPNPAPVFSSRNGSSEVHAKTSCDASLGSNIHSGRNFAHIPLPRSDRVKRMVRKGIPMSHRANAWFKFSGAEALSQQDPGLYIMLLFREEQDRRQGYTSHNNPILEFVDIIERDLYRTFPDNERFQHRPRSAVSPNSPLNSSKPTHHFRSDSRQLFYNFGAEAMDTTSDLSCQSSDSTYASSSVESLSSIDSAVSLSSSKTFSYSAGPDPWASGHIPDPSACKQSPDTKPTKPHNATPKVSDETNPCILSLRQILVSFAYYSWPHPDESRMPWRTCPYSIGYCQSLNFIVGMLLLVFLEADPEVRRKFDAGDEETRSDIEKSVFWMLVSIVEYLLPPEMYGSSLEGSQIQQEVLWTWILRHKGAKFGLGRLSQWLEQAHDGSIKSTTPQTSTSWQKNPLNDLVQRVNSASSCNTFSMVTTPWFLALFVNSMPTETVLRIWDCFFYQGEKILFRVALTLLHIHEEQIIACQDIGDAWRLLKDLPKQVIDCEEFMKLCFKPRVIINPFGSGLNPASPRLNRFPMSPRLRSIDSNSSLRQGDAHLTQPHSHTSNRPNIHNEVFTPLPPPTLHHPDHSTRRSRLVSQHTPPISPFPTPSKRCLNRAQSPNVYQRPISPFGSPYGHRVNAGTGPCGLSPWHWRCQPEDH